MRIELHPQAEQDLAAAAGFYRRTGSARIAGRFITEFHRVVGLLKEQPGLGSPLADNRRSMPMNVFPFAVIYRANSSALRVLVVKHDRQHPTFGSGRR